MNLENLSQQRVLSITEVLELTGKTRATFWRHRKAGKAPRCLMDGSRVVGVTVGDFLAWQEALRDGQ
jgi:predicted DNA-binding transcriptional regulator AlpA